MFWTFPLSIIRSYSLYTQHCCMSYRQLSSSSRLSLLESCLQTCMTYTIAVCTVNNSWWRTEELSETCRVSFQNKFEKLVHLVDFIIRKFVTMQGHMNVKYYIAVSDEDQLINTIYVINKKYCNTGWCRRSEMILVSCSRRFVGWLSRLKIFCLFRFISILSTCSFFLKCGKVGEIRVPV
jgi:hypothetical protein